MPGSLQLAASDFRWVPDVESPEGMVRGKSNSPQAIDLKDRRKGAPRDPTRARE